MHSGNVPHGRTKPLSPATWRGFFVRRSAQPTVRLGVRVVGLLSSGEIGKLCMARHDQLSPAPRRGFCLGPARIFFFVQTAFNIAMLPRLREENTLGENTMIKLIAAAGFLVAVATSAHAITPAPIPQPDGMLSQVRLGCGPFRTRVAGICVARTTIRHTRRLDRRAYRRGY